MPGLEILAWLLEQLEPAVDREWLWALRKGLAAAAVLEPWWQSKVGQFWRATRKPAFAQSGRKHTAELWRQAPRSVFGVLQLAYFSMRYGLLPKGKPGEFYQKSYLAVFCGSTPKRTLLGYFRHRTYRFASPVKRQKADLKIVGPILRSGLRSSPNLRVKSDTPVVGTPGLDRFLDVGRGKLFGNCPFGQFGDLGV